MAALEHRVIEKIAAALKSSLPPRSLRLGIGDDAALFRPTPGSETILTCDWFLEGSHFLRGTHPPESIGWKCLARAVSDIAAMGGQPKAFLLSLALPRSFTGRWLDHFLKGLRRASQRFRCQIAGGDTTRSNEVLIHISVLGEVRTDAAVQRSGARRGDLIFVTGRLGEAECGLRAVRLGRAAGAQARRCIQKHLYPEPRLALGRWLARNRIASAMMDLSDGLSSDLLRLCAASHVGARIEAAKIPSVRLPNAKQALELALNGGDDYELLFTTRRSMVPRLSRGFRGIALAQIGVIIPGRKIVLAEQDGTERVLRSGGWDPFRSGVGSVR